MKTYYECFPCFINQALRAMKHYSQSSEQNEIVLRKILKVLSEMDFTLTPPEMTREMFDIVEKHYQKRIDVYKKEKESSNSYIMNMYEELQNLIKTSKDPFDTALRLAITGNIIDFGANLSFINDQIHKEIDTALAFDDLDSDSLKKEIEKAERILYIGDNAGEIVFDKLFIELLPKEKITYAVRGRHILNDALVKDAEMVGMDKLVRIIDNGTAMPGTVLKYCSDEFVKEFKSSDLVIAKGQGNYETLSEVDHNIFFLLRIKCPVVGRDINRQTGSFFAGKRRQPNLFL